MNIDALNGNVTIDSFVQSLIDALSNFVPYQEVQALYDQFSRLVSVTRDGVTGEVGVATIGRYIGDLATNICGLLPQCKFSTVISVLWDLSSLL